MASILLVAMAEIDLGALLRQLIEIRAHDILPGKTTLFMWRDRDHLLEWYHMRNATSQAVRVQRAPNSLLPMLQSPGFDYACVSMAALALSGADDLSDARCLHWITLEKTVK